ncbi:ABC transporter permease [Actinoallomurus spadix]|uniref:ABC transporter permease n=1 Tax=Actinoallomurus spadix TaxID=79912 RepID=A0ABN0W5D9_9ACTN|nr:ABC transporter permease [Actinoallomurus spadix]MCO5986080.1 ABC transporter permease [Actinoallomurus spadix]
MSAAATGIRTSLPQRRRLRKALTGTALRWSVFAVAVGLWQLATRTVVPEDYQIYFPPPTTIGDQLYRTWFSGPASHAFLTATATHDLLPSLARLLGAWAVSAVVGIVLGVSLGRSEHAVEYVEPLIHFGRSIPATTVIPVFIVLFKFSTAMRVSVIVFGVIWTILIYALEGARSVEPLQLDLARVFKLGRLRRLSLIVVPAAAPKIFAGLRISLSLSIILMTTSELVGASNGIGFFLANAKKTFALPEMWSAIVLLGILGYVLNSALLQVERRIMGWHRNTRRIED